MADSDELGAIDDFVRLSLGGEEAKIVESYEVRRSIHTQPAAFSIRLGWGDVLVDLVKKFPPNTPFQLSVGNVLQHTGMTDGYELGGNPATEMTVRGRDDLAPLHDSYIGEDRSFVNATFLDLVQGALDASGIKDYAISFSNEANRKAITGSKVQQLSPVTNAKTGVPVDAPAPAKKTISAKAGERWYPWLKHELDRVGLFLWSGIDKNFVLSAPNGNQKPSTRIVRRRGQGRNAVNVRSANYKNETTQRYSECFVFTKGGGGRKFGRREAKGSATDDEMVALGYQRALMVRDSHAVDKAAADRIARRKLVEAARGGWSLNYTVAGHTTLSLVDSGRCVWAPDTVVEVIDDEFGLNGPYYLEGVTFRRSPDTTTDLTLMRLDHLVYGLEDGE